MKLNNSKNLKPGDKVIHVRGWVGTIKAVEYIPEENNVMMFAFDGVQINSCDEVEVEWENVSAAARSSSYFLTKIYN